MFRMRSEVFLDELGRGYNAPLGHEVDCYDGQNTTYMMYIDDMGELVGALRINTTNNPYQLQDLMPNVEKSLAYHPSDKVWEASRLYVKKQNRSHNALHVFKCLMTGLVAYALKSKVEKLIYLTEQKKDVLYRRVGFVPHWKGNPVCLHGLTWRAGITYPNAALMQNMLLRNHLKTPLLHRVKPHAKHRVNDRKVVYLKSK